MKILAFTQNILYFTQIRRQSECVWLPGVCAKCAVASVVYLLLCLVIVNLLSPHSTLDAGRTRLSL